MQSDLYSKLETQLQTLKEQQQSLKRNLIEFSNMVAFSMATNNENSKSEF